jgi:ribosomal protein S18
MSLEKDKKNIKDFVIQPIAVESASMQLSAVARSILVNSKNKYQVINKSTIKIDFSLDEVHYLNVTLLKRFLTQRNCIVSIRTIDVRSKKDKIIFKEVVKAIKTARFLALLPYAGQRYLFKNLV